MGFFLSQTLIVKFLLFVLLFLLLLSSSSSSSSVLHDHTNLVKITRSDSPDRYRQVFYIKNTSPFSLDVRRRGPIIGNKKRRRNKITTMKTTTTTSTAMMRKKIKNTEKNRPNFSAMLPKGFVPPSGSSPCHNENPNSVVFFCDLVTTPKP